MRHVVLGGSGFLGRHVVRVLLARGDHVRVADLAAYASDWGARQPEFQQIDLASATPAALDAIVADADMIHHYAWTTIPQTANADPFQDARSNIGLTVGLLEAMRRCNVRRIVFSSSGGTVYGRPYIVPVPESHVLAPITAYGVSKASAELYLNFYRDLYGFETRIARIANPFGAGQHPGRPQGVATTVVHRALAGSPVEVWGDGSVVRDFIHISDVVSALIRIADHGTGTAGAHLVYNVGSGRGASVNQIIAAVERLLGTPIEVVRKPGRPFDVPVNVLDISSAVRDLGWQPVLSLEDGLRLMIEDLRTDPERALSSP